MKINFYASFRTTIGSKTVDIDLPAGSSVLQLVQTLIETYPSLHSKLLDEQGNLYGHVHVFVNGHDTPYLPQAMDTILNEEDQVDVFPPIAGGSLRGI